MLLPSGHVDCQPTEVRRLLIENELLSAVNPERRFAPELHAGPKTQQEIPHSSQPTWTVKQTNPKPTMNTEMTMVPVRSASVRPGNRTTAVKSLLGDLDPKHNIYNGFRWLPGLLSKTICIARLPARFPRGGCIFGRLL